MCSALNWKPQAIFPRKSTCVWVTAEVFFHLLPFGTARFVWHVTHHVAWVTDLLKPKKKICAIESMIFHFARVAHSLFISLLWFHPHSCLLKVRVIKAQAWCPYHSARAETPIVSMTHTGLLERLQPNAKEEKGGRLWALTERITELLTVMSVALITYLCSICHIL